MLNKNNGREEKFMFDKKLPLERREKSMCRGMKVLTIVSILILGLLAAGSAHALLWKFVRIAHPQGSEQPGTQFSMPLYSGTVYPVRLQFRYDSVPAPIASYKLSYTCRGDDFKDSTGARIWKTITTRTCSLYDFCPTKYPWEVPFLQRKVGDIRSCMMKVEIFDVNGNSMDQDTSNQWFDIYPFQPVQ
jgi:hypothetical protein